MQLIAVNLIFGPFSSNPGVTRSIAYQWKVVHKLSTT